jgi:hypothetical protein
MAANNGQMRADASIGQIFVQDTFTGTDATPLISHTGETGATWVTHSSFTTGSGYSIKSNVAITTSAGAASLNYASGIPPSADYEVRANFKILTAAFEAFGQGVAARVQPSPINSCIFFRYVTPGTFQCFQTSTGTSSQIGVSSTVALSAGVTYNIKLAVVGSTVTGSLNGNTVCSGTTSIVQAGRVGVRGVSASNTTGIGIDDLMGVSR